VLKLRLCLNANPESANPLQGARFLVDSVEVAVVTANVDSAEEAGALFSSARLRYQPVGPLANAAEKWKPAA
jgi:hypothetical protein